MTPPSPQALLEYPERFGFRLRDREFACSVETTNAHACRAAMQWLPRFLGHHFPSVQLQTLLWLISQSDGPPTIMSLEMQIRKDLSVCGLVLLKHVPGCVRGATATDGSWPLYYRDGKPLHTRELRSLGTENLGAILVRGHTFFHDPTLPEYPWALAISREEDDGDMYCWPPFYDPFMCLEPPTDSKMRSEYGLRISKEMPTGLFVRFSGMFSTYRYCADSTAQHP